MNFIKRAFLGITRKTGKSFILLAVIFILGNVISGAVSIQQATDNVELNIKERLGATAKVRPDFEAIDKLTDEERMEVEIQFIDVDLIRQIGELPYVKYYDYNVSTTIVSENIEYYIGEALNDYLSEGYFVMDFTLKGINYNHVIDLKEEKATLIDGRVFTQEEIESGAPVTIISKKVAQLNNLHIGDTFTLLNEVADHDDETGEEVVIASRDVVLEIIGLFDPKSISKDKKVNEDNAERIYSDNQYQNTMYVPNEVVDSEEKYWWDMYKETVEDTSMREKWMDTRYTPIFILNSPEDTEAFRQEVIPLLPEYNTVISATDHYDSIAGHVELMSELAKNILLVAVIATVLITGLVVLLFLRDRRHELGIYLSLGERRIRVVGQILIEVMVIGFVGITLSLFSGNLIAEQISDAMMQTDDINVLDEEGITYIDFQTDLTTDDVLDSYEINFNLKYILGFYIIGLLTILISTVIPLIYILRLNPKKILM